VGTVDKEKLTIETGARIGKEEKPLLIGEKAQILIFKMGRKRSYGKDWW